jgi:hypothetical protein
MKCMFKSWSGVKREMELSAALAPEACHDGGVAEHALALAQKNSEVIGRLAALMVERGVISFDEAKHACEAYNIYELEKPNATD